MKINYVIGRYWHREPGRDSIAAYTEFNNTVFYDTEENAFKHAQRLSASACEEYRVFRLFDLGRYFDPDPC